MLPLPPSLPIKWQLEVSLYFAGPSLPRWWRIIGGIRGSLGPPLPSPSLCAYGRCIPVTSQGLGKLDISMGSKLTVGQSEQRPYADGHIPLLLQWPPHIGADTHRTEAEKLKLLPRSRQPIEILGCFINRVEETGGEVKWHIIMVRCRGGRLDSWT